MTLITRASGVALYSGNGGIVVCAVGTAGYYTAAFVFTLITVLLSVLGVGLLVRWGVAGAIPLGLEAIGGFILSREVAAIKRRHDTPFEKLTVVARFALEEGTLQSADGVVLAPLSQVQLQRKMQLTSSAPVLVARWPAGSVDLVRGNPFAGGIEEIERALKSGLAQSAPPGASA
jgi:hypothetical protein